MPCFVLPKSSTSSMTGFDGKTDRGGREIFLFVSMVCGEISSGRGLTRFVRGLRVALELFAYNSYLMETMSALHNPAYAALLAKVPPKVIRTEEENEY